MTGFRLLDHRRGHGLCARCGTKLTVKERAQEGVGGSYVRCERCVNALLAGADVEPEGTA